MTYLDRIIVLNIIIFIFFLTVSLPAHASGFVFNWNPFIVDAGLALKSSDREIPIKNSSVAHASEWISEDYKDIYFLPDDQNNTSTPKPEKKSMPGNMRISFFQTNTFMKNEYEMRAYSDEEQASKFIDAMTSFIYDNSRIKSLETIGKIIEPQINFYFEF
jgi:hypothetical protein